MSLKWKTSERDLKFSFNAGTSRGILTHKLSAFLFIENTKGELGIGEAGPLKGLSEEFGNDIQEKLFKAVKTIDFEKFEFEAWQKEEYQLPSSLKFAVETAILDLNNGGKRKIYNTNFFNGTQAIPINGLVWMGEYDFMRKQMHEKIKAGFKCIKIKIGAIEIEKELSLIRELRKDFSKDDIELRVDANGAFSPGDAMEVMNTLNQFGIHSIEQPIQAGKIEDMAKLSIDSKLPIALDEELIGVRLPEEKKRLLEEIKPEYIVLKPSLHGGLYETSHWINLANQLNIGWWVTSALESNIGLNAISQFVSQYHLHEYQGLGTGQLYENNIPSPLEVKEGHIHYDQISDWDLSGL